ncbi:MULTISPECIES: thiaminase II/PqqC family protein [Kitasatospora]|uniref:Thiaminase-2/PQQC domain-containing protein n=1 Tax=Kitasatospora cystarginea TaxID=58350 RepID=A0ABP5Q8U3_9ACTN
MGTSAQAREVLQTVRRELAPDERQNRLLPLIAEGRAPVAVLAELAAQQHRIITSDRRSLLVLAARCADGPLGTWFAEVAAGESQALRALGPFSRRCGLTPNGTAAREPLPGCQAYPAFLAWLALNGEPAGTVLALAANFAAWGGYCATVAQALRDHYDFPDEACAFFDFFAEPAPELEELTVEVLAAVGLDTERIDGGRRLGRQLQAYEQMFWNSLADAHPVD